MNRWTRTADLSLPRAQACTAALNDGRLLVIGGLGPQGPVAAVDIYGTGGLLTGEPFTLTLKVIPAASGAIGVPTGTL